MHVLDRLEDHCRTAMLQKAGRGGGRLDDRAVGRQAAAQDGYTGIGKKRVVA